MRSNLGGDTEIMLLSIDQCGVEAASVVSKVGDLHVLSGLKELARLFGLKWNILTS